MEKRRQNRNFIIIFTVLSFSFLQSKEKERTAKKEKEKLADVSNILALLGCDFNFGFAESFRLAKVAAQHTRHSPRVRF